MGKRNPAGRAKSPPADPGCNRLNPCLTVAPVWHQKAQRRLKGGRALSVPSGSLQTYRSRFDHPAFSP